jgi:hypothetical protein
MIIRDLIYFIYIENLPNWLFKFLYHINFFNFTKINKYKYPIFSSKMNLVKAFSSDTKGILTKSFDAYNNYIEINSNKYIKHKNKTKSIRKFHQNSRTATLIIPLGWLDPSSSEGRTQGPQITFFIKGLEKNGYVVRVVEASNNTPTLDDKVLESQLIFIFSLTYFNPSNKLFEKLHYSLNSNYHKFTTIGVITAAPDVNLLKMYIEWTKALQTVIYYEENSEYKQRLEKIFKVLHSPYIQFSPENLVHDKFNPSVHLSALVKFNRMSWAIALKYICITTNTNYFIRLISNVLTYKRIKPSYIPNDLIVQERIKFGFGFVMVHRKYNLDAHLIGSFWDYYRLGVIPLVQMQKTQQISTYLTPYLDYFPIESDFDLFSILLISHSNEDHFNNLRKRIKDRIKYEFNPETVIEKLLNDL